MLEKAQELCKSINLSCLGNSSFKIRVEKDNKQPEEGRVFIQVIYDAPCIKTNEWKPWHGRKFYLSEHMTQDEVVKTVYLAFRLAVEHEVMEGFRINGTALFNPHVDFLELLAVSGKEVSRS